MDYFIAGVGTGGTITGTGKYLKEKIKNLKVIAVEPDSSAVLSGEKAGAHKIQGIGAGFVPKVLDTDIYDAIVRVKNPAHLHNFAWMKSIYHQVLNAKLAKLVKNHH